MSNDATPIVIITNGAARGVVAGSGYCFRGLPFAAPPTGDLRWRPPRPPAGWRGVRDATRFGPSSPQPDNPALTGPTSEDCLYLNVYTPTLGGGGDGGLPVLVWIHGGRFTLGAGRDYDGTKLAALGIVVVTTNHRLGALGFLAHPALASRPGGPSGNYGLMDQAALRWVQDNISRFGGDPDNVTIAGQSSGGLSVLAHMVSRGSHRLFHRAIVESGAFALTQQSLAAAEADGQAFATKAGCPDQTADCLRRLPVADLVSNFPGAAIGVPAARAETIAAEYPLDAYPSPPVAFSALLSDANFACPALQTHRWTSKWIPTFAYGFNDDNAPLRYPPPLTGPPVATHKSEFPYLFDLPDAPLQEPLSPDQQALAASMRTAWANFTANGNPESADVASIRRGRHPGAVARSAAAAGRDGLRRQAPLCVLGRRITAPLTACFTGLGTSAANRPGRCRACLSAQGPRSR